MPEIQQWFQWRVKAIVNVEAGANMAGTRLNLARCAILPALPHREFPDRRQPYCHSGVTIGPRHRDLRTAIRK